MYTKTTTSLEKVFHDTRMDDYPEIHKASMLMNEIYSYQIIHQCKDFMKDRHIIGFKVISPISDYIKTYKVKEIPSQYPVIRGCTDDNYLRKTPGLYPDLLEPTRENDRLIIYPELQSLWVEIAPRGEVPAGKYPITVEFWSGEKICEENFEIEIIGAKINRDEFSVTQWFYLDCLMNYYELDAFSEKHWTAIDNFMANAAKYGQNMILTPVLSPELDTHEGGYRKPAQLTDITLNDGKYGFSFEKLGRWVDLCRKNGIKTLEINHFFTQWGGAHCPQVYATKDGEYKRIFGWETDSGSEEYKEFLGALIPSLIEYLTKTKQFPKENIRFHISDEPNMDNLERYKKLYNIVKPLIGDMTTMDALSEYEFYKRGLVDCPVAHTPHVAEFAEKGAENIMAYYCCGPVKDYSNRFFAMPSQRTRILGVQLWKYNVKGFLHWGYNFWNTFLSYAALNPFTCSDGEGFASSGDMFIVYPGTNLTPWPSLRALVFNEGLQDRAALSLCEKLIGREKTMELLSEDKYNPLTFESYPHEAKYLLDLRERLNLAIKNAIETY